MCTIHGARGVGQCPAWEPPWLLLTCGPGISVLTPMFALDFIQRLLHVKQTLLTSGSRSPFVYVTVLTIGKRRKMQK